MKKKIIGIFLYGLLTISLVGCMMKTDDVNNDTTTETNTETDTHTDTDTEMDINNDDNKIPNKYITYVTAKQNNNYENITDIMKSLDINNENVILSPTSLEYALGMVALGSDSTTSKALQTYFNNDLSLISTRHKELMQSYSNYNSCEINLANMIYADNNFPIKDSYVSDFQNIYYGDISNEDFQNDYKNVANNINKFCADSTNNKIKDIIDGDTIKQNNCILINALYFNGEWESPFDENNIQDTKFNSINGEQNIKSLSGIDSKYFETDNSIGFSKYYLGEDFEFIGILPNKEICDENGNFDISDIDIQAFLDSKTMDYDVMYKMPKFKIETKNELKNALMSNGLEILFDPTQINLTNLSDSIVISDIIQKTYIEVNEKGTEAAAVTDVEIKTTSSMPEEKELKEVILDRPFMFMIYDNVNKEILFIGKIVSINE